MTMDTVSIICATRGREKKLRRMMASLVKMGGVTPWRLLVGFDGDWAGFVNFRRMIDDNTPSRYACFHYKGHNGAVAVRNRLAAMTDGAVLYVTDDIEFRPRALDHAVQDILEHFPDGDGVIGIRQEGNAYHPTGIALIGSKFMERYPNRAIFYPGYFHFAAQEVQWASRALARFYASEKATVFHHHPAHDPKELDATHREARVKKAQDEKVRMHRKKMGLIWGYNDMKVV